MEIDITTEKGGHRIIQFSGEMIDPMWVESAGCKAVPPDDLYVQGAAQNSAVTNICRKRSEPCPVQLPCLIEALENGIDHGVWGGLTERERRRFARGAGKELIEQVRAERERRKAAHIARNKDSKHSIQNSDDLLGQSALALLVQAEAPKQQAS